jgi:hypothetical protein
VNTSEVLMMEENVKLTLQSDILKRYRITKETQFRFIETQKGVLLIPLSGEPMNDELKNEIEDWQSLGVESWEVFDYEEKAP